MSEKRSLLYFFSHDVRVCVCMCVILCKHTFGTFILAIDFTLAVARGIHVPMLKVSISMSRVAPDFAVWIF